MRRFFLLLVLCSVFVSSTQLCYFKGPELSQDLLQLTDFSVSGNEKLVEGDFIDVSFSLKNLGQTPITFADKGVFVAARDSKQGDASFGFTSQGKTIKPSETVLLQASRKLDSQGAWSFWPSYEIIFAKGTMLGPDYWHACTLEVIKEAPTATPTPTATPSPSIFSVPTPTPVFTGCFDSVRGRIEDFRGDSRTVGIQLCKALRLSPGGESRSASSFIVGGSGGIRDGLGNTLAGMGVVTPVNFITSRSLPLIESVLPFSELNWVCDPSFSPRYANLSSHNTFEFNNLCPNTYKVSVYYKPFSDECRWVGTFADEAGENSGPRIINSSNASNVVFFFRPLETTPPEIKFEFDPAYPNMSDGFRLSTNASDENGIQKIKMQVLIDKTNRVKTHCRMEDVQYEHGGPIERVEVCDYADYPEYEFLSNSCSRTNFCSVIEASNPNATRGSHAEGVTNYAITVNASVCDGAGNKRFLEQYFDSLPTPYSTPIFESKQPELEVWINPETRLNAWREEAYRQNEIFLVPDTDWRAVLQVLPVTIWPDSGSQYGSTTEKKYPLIVFHQEENGAFDLDAAINFIKRFAPRQVKHVTVFLPTNLATNPNFDDVVWTQIASNGILENPAPDTMQRIEVNPNAKVRFFYFDPHNATPVYDFFFEIKNRVLVSPNTYESALKNSVLAAYYHLPLYLVNDFSFDDIRGKNVTAVDVSAGVEAVLKSYAKQVNEGASSVSELQSGFDSVSEGKTILVNPRDVRDWPSMPRPEIWPVHNGGASVKSFARMSLAAPYLAVARREKLLFYADEPFTQNDGACDSTVHTALHNKVTRDIAAISPSLSGGALTIVADPRFIVDSYYSSCYDGQQMRIQVDREYNPDGVVGRIYGITVTDASAYVARSVFISYSSLFEYTGGDSWGSYYSMPAMLITHSIMEDIVSARNIRGCCGFDWECHAPSGEGCDTNISPPSSNYLEKIFITYLDHGSYDAWHNTIGGTGLPCGLNSPVVFGDACLTNNFWSGSQYTMGAWWIRKGASAYFGAVGVTMSYDCGGFGSYTSEAERFTNYWRRGSTTLGILNRDLDSCSEHCWTGTDDCDGRDSYLMLGDPLYRIPDTSSVEVHYPTEEGGYDCGFC
ncbi:MAG: C25 family cysteine peptidase [Candidatus Micrarchaeota archaeon]